MRSPFPPFPYTTLETPLRDTEREAVAAGVRELLRFQRTLSRWAPVRSAPDATPFVSLYAEGSLRGCFGCHEGGPAERLMRAFLRAQDDGRFGGVSPAQRAVLAAQVSYPRDARLMNPDTVEEEIEPGTHGIALVHDRAPAVLLLPHVARDEGVGTAGLLQALRRKAGLGDDLGGGALYRFETEDVVVRPEGRRGRTPDGKPEDLAAAWLASLVAPDGRVTFAVDSRSRKRIETGAMAHGRAAVVVQALAAHGGWATPVTRARKRLATEIRAALGGASIEGWPSDPPAVAGTLALAVLAGVPVIEELAAFVGGPAREAVAHTPWHAGQVVAALGARAPANLWEACVADLDRRPWAPWTAIAAAARGDRAVRARSARNLADALRTTPPHRGGAEGPPIPEVALTAVSVEALARHPASWARTAALRGRAFVASMQLVGPRLYAALDPALALGAVPASPVADLLRGDVTGHALLALLAVSG
jgi:AMMECR1 domain-containing protein